MIGIAISDSQKRGLSYPSPPPNNGVKRLCLIVHGLLTGNFLSVDDPDYIASHSQFEMFFFLRMGCCLPLVLENLGNLVTTQHRMS